MSLLRERNRFTFQLLTEVALVVSEQLNVIEFSEKVTALPDKVILIKWQSLTCQVEQVPEIIARIES